MREIKFRAWDTEKEVMTKVNCIGLNDYEVGMEDNDCRCWNAPYPYVCKLMQYTGLKDKNDNEIYEGDIVLIKNNKFKVKFQIGSFMLVRISQETDMYELFKDCWNDDVYPLSQYIWNYEEDLEIVGNIYEGDYK